MKKQGTTFLKRIWIVFMGIFFSPWACAQEGDASLNIPFKVSELNLSIFRFLYEWFVEAWSSFSTGLASLADFVLITEWIYHSFSQPQIRAQFIEFSIELTASLLIGLALERILTPTLTPFAKRLRNMEHWEHFWRNVSYVAVGLIPIALFGLGFYFTFRLLEPVGVIYLQIATIFINGVTTTWAFIRTSRLIFLPHKEQSHIPFTEDTLHFAYRGLKYLAITILIGYFLEETGKLIGLPQEGHKLVLQITTFIVLLQSIKLVWGLNNEFTHWLYEQRTCKDLLPWERKFLACLHLTPIFFVYLMVLSYMTWVIPFDEFLLVAWKIVVTLILIPTLFYGHHILHLLENYWIEHHLKLFSPKFCKKMKFYERQIEFVIDSLLTLILALFAVWFWNGNPLFFLYTELGQLITEKILSFIVIVGLAFFLLRAGRSLISHYLDPKGARGLSSSERAHMNTVHGIVQSVLQIVIWIPATLLMLAELDVDIIPAATVLGVLGVGLSLGIQSTIQDFVTGIFILLENTLAVGDVIEVNGKIGTVESLTIRIIRIRSMDGTISSFPYGKIDKVSNFTREYSVAILLITIARGEDVEKVCQLIGKLDEKLHKSNSLVKELVLEPANIDGVTEATDSALTIRIRIKTKPKQHWAIKRLYTNEITALLDQKGIHRGHPIEIVYERKATTLKK